MMKQHLAILADNKPGVLTHVAGLISRRAINIEYINAGYTEEPDVTRINIVVSVENRWELDQAVNQLAKLIDVIKVVNLDDAPFVSYELAMIKVKCETPTVREELTNIAHLFHAKVVDVQKKSLSDYLNQNVFAECKKETSQPDEKISKSFEVFYERYKKGLAVEKAAVESL